METGRCFKKGTSFALVVEGLDSCFFLMNITPNDTGTFSLNEGNHWGVDDNLKYLKDFHIYTRKIICIGILVLPIFYYNIMIVVDFLK